MKSLTEYRKAINVLVARGNVIVQVIVDDENSFFYSALTFSESTQNASESTEYSEVKGVDITDFLERNISNPNGQTFVPLYESFILSAPVIRLRSSKGIKWLKYSLATS